MAEFTGSLVCTQTAVMLEINTKHFHHQYCVGRLIVQVCGLLTTKTKSTDKYSYKETTFKSVLTKTPKLMENIQKMCPLKVFSTYPTF